MKKIISALTAIIAAFMLASFAQVIEYPTFSEYATQVMDNIQRIIDIVDSDQFLMFSSNQKTTGLSTI